MLMILLLQWYAPNSIAEGLAFLLSRHYRPKMSQIQNHRALNHSTTDSMVQLHRGSHQLPQRPTPFVPWAWVAASATPARVSMLHSKESHWYIHLLSKEMHETGSWVQPL